MRTIALENPICFETHNRHREIVIFTDQGIFGILYEFDGFYGKDSCCAYKLTNDFCDFDKLLKRVDRIPLNFAWDFFKNYWKDFTLSDFYYMFDIYLDDQNSEFKETLEKDRKFFINVLLQCRVLDNEHLI